jgi:hypothetical protein
MNLNNNWNLNIDLGKWTKKSDTLRKSDFDSLMQDFESFRFYQKCLSGSTYTSVNSFISGDLKNSSVENIYDILDLSKNSYFYNFSGQNPIQYLEPFGLPFPESFKQISNLELAKNFQTKIISEYNWTLKTLFTPERLIKEKKKNQYYVDLATTESIQNLDSYLPGLIIDGNVVKEGQRILVKDQFLNVTLATSINPDDFFFGEWVVVETVGLNTTYRIPSSKNGIYVYNNRRLVRDKDLDLYDNLIDYLVTVKMGDVNRELSFKLKRLKSGLFPEYNSNFTYPNGPIGESLFFEESDSFIIRQKVDYNNLYELSLQKTISHGESTIFIDGITYSIPERNITIGEFGSIINHQQGVTNIVDNKYKSTLRGISETSRYYWVCGDDGLLLRVNKIDFIIKRIKLEYPSGNDSNSLLMTTLKSISFFNDLCGVVVGKFNQIWVTKDGGNSWKQIYLVDFDGFNYNTVTFTDIDKFYVGGDNGVFIEFEFNLGKWIARKRRISKFIDGLDDEFVLVDNITDIKYFSDNNSKYVIIGCELNSIFLYDINNQFSNFDFISIVDDSGENLFGDITSINWSESQNKIYFSTFDGIYDLDLFGSVNNITPNNNVLFVDINKIITQSGINSIFEFDSELFLTGNFSLWRKSSDFTTSIDVWDSTFFNRLKPRLLFMDYDIGSKLYWFDDFGQYRIPSRYGVDVLDLGTSSQIGFYPIQGELNWIEYWKDSKKTFEYMTDLDEQFIVKPSFDFNYSTLGDDKVVTNFTTNYNYVIGLMPTVVPIGELSRSKFRNIGETITLPSNPFELYFYGDIGIWQIILPLGEVGPDVGDVLNIKSDLFEGDFIINKIISETNVTQIGVGATLEFSISTFSPSDDIVILYDGNPISGTISGDLNQTALYNSIVDSINLLGTFSAINLGSIIQVTSGVGSQFNGNTISLTGSLSPTLTSGIFSGGLDDITGTRYFMYFYTDFNDNILNSVNSLNQITVKNLNKYTNNFKESFNKHYIGLSYNCELVEDKFIITPKYSQFSAYYNLQLEVRLTNTSQTSSITELKYRDSFLNFGYSPTYNLLSYLNYLDPQKWLPTTRFGSLPNWINVPGPSLNPGDVLNQIFIDLGVADSNKLYIGENLKYIWDSLPKWIFVDVECDSELTNRLLIIDKYLDDKTYPGQNWWVIEFHSKISYLTNVQNISIKCRRTLKQISDDLQYINNIQRPELKISKSGFDSVNAPGGTWSNLESDINFKIPTDSYTRILLTNNDLVKSLSGVIYTDYKNELAMQVTNLGFSLDLVPTTVVNSNGLYQIYFNKKHGLSNNDFVIISLVSGNLDVNKSKILGYQNVQVISDFIIRIPIQWAGSINTQLLKVSILKKDNFFNFQPIDYFDFGVNNKKVTQSVRINEENFSLVGTNYSLNNLDLTKFRFKLVDSLDLVRLTQDFGWILEGEITDAIIGQDKDGLVWYSGNWKCGRWFGGKWISGQWISGDWYKGIFTSKLIKKNSPDIGGVSSNNFSSKWFGGRWFGGTWENGTWYDGRFYDGEWKDGRWFRGTWNNGTWFNGEFKSGIWIEGNWKGGRFNTTNGSAFWLNGRFSGGDFENGVWYNGVFEQPNGLLSRFGTKSTNSRRSIWKSGKFLSGEFHSFLNLDDFGNPQVSDVHKLSIWETGQFLGGEFWGGLVYSINFKNGVWYGGILEDIEVNSINPSTNTINLIGEYDFNIGDVVYLVDNGLTGTYSQFGSTDEPGRYRVLKSDVSNGSTNLLINLQDSNLLNLPDSTVNNIRLVSSFDNSIWKSGFWKNGVFNGGLFIGGVWNNGYFEGTWG